MDFGVHLPATAWAGQTLSFDGLRSAARAARDLGFAAVSVNDHMVFRVPWIDGPTALAAVLAETGDMTLATTIGNPVVRGPVAFAKALGAIDVLSGGGRLIVGVGPGSSADDYEAVGLAWDERWKRLEEAIAALRSLWGSAGDPFLGRFYSTEGVQLRPEPATPGGPPIWIGSWGSERGMRRVAELGDGWLASAYNATPEHVARGLELLGERLRDAGRDPGTFPNALVTMMLHLTEDRGEADRVLREAVGPALHRPVEEQAERLLIGPTAECAEKLARYRDAGVERVYLWPVDDDVGQLTLFAERVAPQLA